MLMFPIMFAHQHKPYLPLRSYFLPLQSEYPSGSQPKHSDSSLPDSFGQGIILNHYLYSHKVIIFPRN